MDKSLIEINSIEEWSMLADSLLRMGYRVWQMQYGVDKPEGFHAVFCLSNAPDVEVVTHSKAVYDAIMAFGSSH